VQRGDVLALRRTLAVATIAASALVSEREARADSCTSPDLIETIPASGATDVPTNAMLFARYATIAQYLDEPVMFEHPAGVETMVPATFDDTSGLLQITPPMPLTPGDAYVVHWPALRGIDTATLGSTMNLSFTAGSEQDVSPPTFDGITSVTWDVSRNSDSCTGSIDQRYVFTLGLGTAADDGGRDSLTLLVFQTSGSTVDASAPTLVLVQRIPPSGQAAQVTTTLGSGLGHICFAAIVRDLTLKASTSGSPVCVDTVEPPFFYGCGAATGRGARGGLVALSVAAFALARRKRRRSRGRSARAGQGRGDR
jgi:hypothetical protein